jgi:aspartate/methionine/tyrosine aminotransferase
MNPLAEELNKVLEGSTVSVLLSEFGKRFYFPKGIVAQSAEAKKHAKHYNATIGMAYADGEPIELPSIKESIPGMKSTEAVAYAPTGGDPDLRELWKRELIRKNPAVKPEGISTPVVVPGLTNGIAQIADLFLEPGDPVVVPDMFWGNYRLIFEGRKLAEIKGFPFFTAEGGLNVEGFLETVKASARDGKVMLIVNFPNNPTGYSPTRDEAEALSKGLVELAESGLKILAVTDDAYFGLFYEPDTYTHSLFNLLSGAHENIVAVKIDGATKEDFVWGFRVGFVTFGSKGMSGDQYEALNKKLTGAIRSSVSNSSRPAQSILKRALQTDGYGAEKQRYFELLRERYSTVRRLLDAMPEDTGLRPLPFNSGYFMSFDFKGNSEKLRQELLHTHGIGTISIQERYLRVAFASIDNEGIEDLYTKIFEAAKKVSS